MGLARHQKRKKKKSKPLKHKPITKTIKVRSLLLDTTLFHLSKKTCKYTFNNPPNNHTVEKIKRLYARHVLTPDQYLIVLEHAETRLDETIMKCYSNNPIKAQEYQNRIEFLEKTRKKFAQYFGIESTANINGVYDYESFVSG